jgi:predicted RNA-binding Zn ribbon-like protein
MVEVELAGNELCLDFVNSVNMRPAPTRDWFDSPAGARTWAAAVGFDLDTTTVTAEVLADIKESRERLHRVFRALVDGGPPPADEVVWLRERYARAVASGNLAGSLAPGGEGFAMSWAHAGPFEVLAHRIAESVFVLLTRGPLDRLGACPSCGWLFVDTSKNGRRRWCSMASCGARDKARRHYRVKVGTRTPGSGK